MADTNVAEVAVMAATDHSNGVEETNTKMADTDHVAAEAEAAMEDTDLVAAEGDDADDVVEVADQVVFSMGTNVFGEAVTQELLMAIPEFANRARKERADMAMQWKNRDGKYEESVRYVRQLKANWGNGVSTLCVLYNGTGETLSYVTSNNWFGYIYAAYPPVIANGQWGAFFHVKRTAVASGSQAAVVYRGKSKDGQDTDWMVSWDNPWNKASFSNNVYGEINRAGYFDRIDWRTIANSMVGVGLQHRSRWNGCVADLKIENGTSPLFEAVLSLE